MYSGSMSEVPPMQMRSRREVSNGNNSGNDGSSVLGSTPFSSNASLNSYNNAASYSQPSFPSYSSNATLNASANMGGVGVHQVSAPTAYHANYAPTPTPASASAATAVPQVQPPTAAFPNAAMPTYHAHSHSHSHAAPDNHSNIYTPTTHNSSSNSSSNVSNPSSSMRNMGDDAVSLSFDDSASGTTPSLRSTPTASAMSGSSSGYSNLRPSPNGYGMMDASALNSGDLHTPYGASTSASMGLSSYENQKRINQNSQALQLYVLFMYSMIGLSVLTMLVSWFSMSTSSAFYITIVLLICIFSLLYTLHLTQWIMSKDDSNAEMRVVSEAIREGSEGFLRVQYGTIFVLAIIVAVALAILYLFRDPPSHEVSRATMSFVTAVSYLIGAFCSALAGYIGVWVSVRVNIRVAVAASKFSYSDALLLSFRGGAVSACLSASLCILGVTVLYVFCHLFFCVFGSVHANHVPMLLAGYGFGGALVALFMQLGGGIYTKAADVGADMVGKIEQNIPEDDCRNPAVVADLVGDNVGDCAGSMADVFESIAAEVIGTMILGATLASEAKIANPEPFIFFPLVIHALDLVISAAGIIMTRISHDHEDPIEPMKRSYAVSMGIACVAFMATCRLMLYTDVAPHAWWSYGLCGWVGIAMSFVIIRSTQYYTDYHYDPVKRIADASKTGHGTNVISGISVGLESTAIPSITIAVCLFTAYTLGRTSGLPSVAAGVYGTAVATMGMLCTAVYILSMNNFGPIADNAGGIVEMSGQPEQVREITDRLDAVGNVTKAASKGYAVGGSALSCFVLFQAFLDEISAYTHVHMDTINIAKVEVVVGGLMGIMMIYLFAGWAMQSVGKTAQQVVWEVRRQFKDKPGIMDGSDKPDYGSCVSIVTKAALKEMIRPALLALLLPVFIGFFFRYVGSQTGRPMLGIEVIAAFMMFGTLSGLLMASFMDNAGGAWDNAKKLIESRGEKGSEAHKAAVTGDTVGDPFKDTAGPALHVIITTMSTTILVLGPMFVGTMHK